MSGRGVSRRAILGGAAATVPAAAVRPADAEAACQPAHPDAKLIAWCAALIGMETDWRSRFDQNGKAPSDGYAPGYDETFEAVTTTPARTDEGNRAKLAVALSFYAPDLPYEGCVSPMLWDAVQALALLPTLEIDRVRPGLRGVKPRPNASMARALVALSWCILDRARQLGRAWLLIPPRSRPRLRRPAPDRVPALARPSGQCSLQNDIRIAMLASMDASGNGIEIATILPGQVRAARGLIGWSQDQLVEASGVPKRTVARFELGEGAPQRRTLAAIRRALEAAGVEFTNGDQPGVRLRRLRVS